MGERSPQQELPAIRTQEGKGAYRNGREGFGFVWEVAGISKLGIHYTSEFSAVCHLKQLCVCVHKDLSFVRALWVLKCSIQVYMHALHIKNHRDERCHKLYSPHAQMNTMACEQTFAWLSRYKKILSAVPKTHHHF